MVALPWALGSHFLYMGPSSATTFLKLYKKTQRIYKKVRAVQHIPELYQKALEKYQQVWDEYRMVVNKKAVADEGPMY